MHGYLIRYPDGAYNFGPAETRENGFPVMRAEATVYHSREDAMAKAADLGEVAIEVVDLNKQPLNLATTPAPLPALEDLEALLATLQKEALFHGLQKPDLAAQTYQGRAAAVIITLQTERDALKKHKMMRQSLVTLRDQLRNARTQNDWLLISNIEQAIDDCIETKEPING